MMAYARICQHFVRDNNKIAHENKWHGMGNRKAESKRNKQSNTKCPRNIHGNGPYRCTELISFTTHRQTAVFAHF